MNRTSTTACCCVMVLCVLSGCAAYVVNAPVSSRTTASEPQARIASRPGHDTYRPPSGTAGDQYVVRSGDTLYSIAWQQGVEVQQLAALNAIRPPYTIYTGQRLRVPADTATRGAPVAPRQPIEVKPLARPASVPSAPPAAADTAPKPKPVAAAPATTAQAPDYDGKWVWPTRGRVIRGYPQSGAGRKGIDIGGHPDQPVNAAANGKVVYAGSGLVGYGRLIIVKHNESLLSAYGHNSKLLVEEGDLVTAGQMIAKMGNSGSDRTALYFEIRKDGKPVNPMQYLPRI